MPESLFAKRKNEIIVLLKRILHGRIAHLFKIVIKIMKIFNKTDKLESNIFKTDVKINYIIMILCIVSTFLFEKYGALLLLNIDGSASSLLSLLKVNVFILYILVIIHNLYFLCVHFDHYEVKKKIYKTNPIYHFMKPVKRSVANHLYSDLDYLWKTYIKHKQEQSESKTINLTEDIDNAQILFEKLDKEIFDTLKNYYETNNIKQMATIKATDFELYKKLFMRFVMPVEVNCLKSKFDKIEKEFSFQNNKMTPNMFLEVLDKLKVRLDEKFTEDDYVEYKQWFSFVEYKIKSIQQGTVGTVNYK